MKASELIELLQQTPDAEVVLNSANPELRQALVSVEGCGRTRAQRSKRECVDMMDGTRFQADIWEPVIQMQHTEKGAALHSIFILS